MKLQDKLKEYRHQSMALLATNFYNLETLKGVLMAAANCKSPIILQLTRSSIEYMGLPVAYAMAREAIRYFGVEAWIHLDHGDSLKLAAACLEAGFDSVMIDASEKPFAENVSITRRVVELAAKYDACVEAELGFVAKQGQNSNNQCYTKPSDAKEFVERTGVDALAIAIGTAHGFYKQQPRLDLNLLSEIHSNTNASLVLHGSSGIPHQLLSETIRRGICKINLATEIKNTFIKTLREQLTNNDEIDLRKVFPVATTAVTTLVAEKLNIINNNNASIQEAQ